MALLTAISVTRGDTVSIPILATMAVGATFRSQLRRNATTNQYYTLLVDGETIEITAAQSETLNEQVYYADLEQNLNGVVTTLQRTTVRVQDDVTRNFGDISPFWETEQSVEVAELIAANLRIRKTDNSLINVETIATDTEAAKDAANVATGLANTATSNANIATGLANTATGLANTATSNANTATGLANTATTQANAARDGANAAAALIEAGLTIVPRIFEGYANLPAGVETTIPGTSFTPVLNLRPVNVQVFYDGELKNVTAKYVANGDNYDVKLTSAVDLFGAEITLLGTMLNQEVMNLALFDPANVENEPGFYIQSATGVKTAHVNWNLTHYMPAEYGQNVRATLDGVVKAAYVAEYDLNKNIILTPFASINTGYFVINPTCKFIRVSFLNSHIGVGNFLNMRVRMDNDWFISLNDIPALVNKRIPPISFQKKYSSKSVWMGDSIAEKGNAASWLGVMTGAVVYNAGVGGTRASLHTDVNWAKFSLCSLADAICDNDYTLQNTAATNLGVAFTLRNFTKIGLLDGLDWSTVDELILHYGANDIAGGAWIGDVNSVDVTTMSGAYNHAITRIQTAYPNIRIVIASCTWRMILGVDANNVDDTKGQNIVDFIAAQIAIAAKYNLKYIDLYNDLYNWDNRLTMLADDVHPTYAGWLALAQKLHSQL